MDGIRADDEVPQSQPNGTLTPEEITHKSLLLRLESLPEDIIYLIIGYIHPDKARLPVMKIIGPHIHAQILPFLHQTLHVDVLRHEDQDFEAILQSPFLKHVRTLQLHDNRNRTDMLIVTEYPAFLSLVSELHNLRSAYISLPHRLCDLTKSLLSVLGGLTGLSNLHLDQTFGHYRALSAAGSSSPASATSGLAYTWPATEFLSLNTLAIGNMLNAMFRDMQAWLLTRQSLQATSPQKITRLEINTCRHGLKQVWKIIKSLANALQKVVVVVPERLFYESGQATKFAHPVTFPSLRVLSFVGNGNSEVHNNDYGALFGAMDMPALQQLACGDLLRRSSKDTCLALAQKWLKACPDLKLVLFRGMNGEPYYAQRASLADSPGLEVFKRVFEGTQTNIIRSDEHYEAYFRRHMPFDGNSEPRIPRNNFTLSRESI